MAERFCVCGDPIPSGRQGRSEFCAACALAFGPPSLLLGKLQGGERWLPVTCWCERTTVWVAAEANRRGLTGSCGLPSCTQDLVAA